MPSIIREPTADAGPPDQSATLIRRVSGGTTTRPVRTVACDAASVPRQPLLRPLMKNSNDPCCLPSPPTKTMLIRISPSTSRQSSSTPSNLNRSLVPAWSAAPTANGSNSKNRSAAARGGSTIGPPLGSLMAVPSSDTPTRRAASESSAAAALTYDDAAPQISAAERSSASGMAVVRTQAVWHTFVRFRQPRSHTSPLERRS